MKALSFAFLALATAFTSGCCSFHVRPLKGTAHVAFRGDGPLSDTGTGSIICVFGTYAHPSTKWQVASRGSAQPQVHSVTQSLDDVVTGIPAGRHVIVFSTSGRTKPPCPKCVEVEKDRTVIVSVDYHEF